MSIPLRLSLIIVKGIFVVVAVFALFSNAAQAQLLQLKSWEIDNALAAKKADYFNAFKSGNVDSDREGLEKFFDNYYFARWTALEDLGEGQMVSTGQSQQHARELLQDFRDVNGNAREYLLNKSLQTFQKMAADNTVHPSARYNAILAVGQLCQREPTGRNNPPVLYAQALPYLIAEYQKENNPQYLKLAALIGIVRHARVGITDETMKNQTVPNLCLTILRSGKPAQGVDKEDQEMKDWFRQNAMDALAGLKTVGPNGQTVNALEEILSDASESIEIRTKAARTLGDLDYQTALAAGTTLNYQRLGSALITLMKATCDAELQTVIQLRDKARVKQGRGAVAPGTVEDDPPFSAITSPEERIEITGVVQSIKSNVQNVVYGLRGQQFSRSATQGIQPMLPSDDAVTQKINAMMNKGVNPLFKKLDEGPAEDGTRPRADAGDGRGGKPPGADEKLLKVNLLNIRDALQEFSLELDGIISGAGT